MENKKIKEISLVDGMTMYCSSQLEKDKIEFDSNEVKEIVKALEIKGSLQELRSKPDLVLYFLKMCRLLKLNPLLNEIYCVPYSNKLQVIVDFKQYIARAKQCEGYCGYETILVDRKPTGEALPLNEVYYIVKCKRKDDEFVHTSIYYMNEWKKDFGEWKTKPKYMLEKTAIKNTLAHVFPEALSSFNNVENDVNLVIDNEVATQEQEQEKLLDIKKVVGK